MRICLGVAVTALSLTPMATFVAAEHVVGSICIAPLPEKVEEADRLAFSGGPRRHYTYEFTVAIDERAAIAVPKGKAVLVEAMELLRAHRVRIRDDGRVIESFRFTFAEHGGFPLCLAYTPGYQAWSLERARPGQKWCECEASWQGPSNNDLQRTRPAPAMGPLAAEVRVVRTDQGACGQQGIPSRFTNRSGLWAIGRGCIYQVQAGIARHAEPTVTQPLPD